GLCSTYIYALSLHDALPISLPSSGASENPIKQSIDQSIQRLFFSFLLNAPHFFYYCFVTAPPLHRRVIVRARCEQGESERARDRSEEHTSELQSRENVVFRL